MTTDFKNSETAKNLMRAFAGESQARNRYSIAADRAKEQKLTVVEAVFRFTAEQERAHAEVFYNHLQKLDGTEITVDGGYPVNVTSSVVQLLRYAEGNEYKEHDEVYKAFAETAKNEGFAKIATDFESIARIEKQHGDRFAKLAEQIESGKLFLCDAECGWMCLNCGNVLKTKGAPEKCPVCGVDQGFFIRLTLAPYTE
ncbi:MAG: rubrerythrin family protein [Clostridia bacterium]|nr:rubrerythrin family protein [Clostridia bacterium]